MAEGPPDETLRPVPDQHAAENDPATYDVTAEVVQPDQLVPEPDEQAVSSNEPVAPPDQQVPALAAAGVWRALGWCLLAVGAQIVVGVQFGGHAGRFQQAPNAVDLFTLNGVCIALCSAAIVASIYAGRVRHVVSLRCPNWFHIVIVLLLVVPMYVVALAVQDCVASVRQGTAGAVTEGMFSLLSTAAPQVEQLAGLDKWFMELARESWLTILVLGCVLPAVGEELFFRGFLGRGLVGRYGQPLGVLLTSLAFGLFHLAPERIVAATILGISLHIVYLSAKSLYAPMILHGLNNFLALGISHWFQDGTLNPSMGAEEMFFPWSLPLFGMITLVVLLAVVCLGRIQSHRLIVRKSWVMWIRPSSTIAAWPTCSLASTIERLPTCPRPFNSIPAIPLR